MGVVSLITVFASMFALAFASVFEQALVPVLAASDDSSAAFAAPLILALSGFVFFGIMHARYRNADKRHSYERETKATIENVLTLDQLIKHEKGLSNASMHGANDSRIEGALNTGGNMLEKFAQGSAKLLK